MHSQGTAMNPSATDMPRAVPLIGRVLLALLFLVSGAGKIALPGATQGYIASAGLPFPLLAYVVAVVVALGGAAVPLTREPKRWAAAVPAGGPAGAAPPLPHKNPEAKPPTPFLQKSAHTAAPP